MTDPDLPPAPSDDDLDGDLDGDLGDDLSSNPGGDFDAGPEDPAPADGVLLATPAHDRARIADTERRLREIEDRLDAAAPEPEPAPPPAAPKAPKYQALAEFVNEEFCPRYTRRRQGGRWRWCPQWWEHSEAVSRLDALHKAWEAMHDDGPTGMGDWYRNHLDHQLPILMGADGPFRGCAEQHWAADPADDLRTGTPHGDNMAWRIA